MRKKSKTPKKKPQKVIYVVNNIKSKLSKKLFKEILRLQNSTDLLIPKLPFSRLIREITQQFRPDLKIQLFALQALQEAAELYLTTLFSDANRLCAHAKRVTLRPVDMQLVLDLRGVNDPGYGNAGVQHDISVVDSIICIRITRNYPRYESDLLSREL